MKSKNETAYIHLNKKKVRSDLNFGIISAVTRSKYPDIMQTDLP